MTAPTPHKRTHGQFFTEGNPFVHAPFRAWFESIPEGNKACLLEPFAGSNNIIRLMREAGYENRWACFDVDPPHGLAEGVLVHQRDTLADFPEGFEVVVTNPPYLAKNSAARRGLPYPPSQHDDLYKHALEVTLGKVPFVAAIIPESFVVAEVFHDRILATVSLTSKMFNDTDCPVCLALFVPTATKENPADFEIWDEGRKLGQYLRFQEVLSPVPRAHRTPWKFNDPQGSLGLRGVDDTRCASIRFVRGETIPSSEIKHSSRAISRIAGLPPDIDLDLFIEVANKSIDRYRRNTHDALMTSFKGLREDGKYRRRLDFAAARNLMDHCVLEIRSSGDRRP